MTEMKQIKMHLFQLLSFMVLLPIVSAGETPRSAEQIRLEIKQMAHRHVEAESPMDTGAMLQSFSGDTKIVSQREMSATYEQEYIASKAGQSVFKKFMPSAGWVVAIILLFVTALKERLQKWLSNIGSSVAAWARRKFGNLAAIRRLNLKKYCDFLIREHSELAIPFSKRKLSLNNIFVPLQVAEQGAAECIDAIESINQHRRIVITGNPGAGKSVLLSYLTLTFAKRGSKSLLSSKVPILLPLHSVTEDYSSEGLHACLVRELARCKLPEAEQFLNDALRRGNVMFLFDGLDEVPTVHRCQIVQGIKVFLSRASALCGAVITCRTAVYQEDFHASVAAHFVLCEFNDQQMETFLQPWQEHMPPERSIENLLSTLRDRPRIMAMARNPLQLTMICSLYANEHEKFTLPHSRSEFYGKATFHFLERWHSELGRNRFSAPHKAAVLEGLARHLHAQGAGEISKSSIDKRSAPFEEMLSEATKILPKLNLDPTTNAQAILDEIVERSGLLLRIDAGERYQFAHLTIQEYYTARSLGGNIDDLIKYFKEDPLHWREVVRLWCGLDHDSSHLIQRIYELDKVMALECLADAQRVDSHLAEGIVTYFKDNIAEEIASDHTTVTEAYAALASAPGARGVEMLAFLGATLEGAIDRSLREALARAIRATNLPSAASMLFTLRGKHPDLCDSVVAMGIVGIRCLSEFARNGNCKAIEDLLKIGTVESAMGLLNLLTCDNSEICPNAAWAVLHFLSQISVIEYIEMRTSSVPQHPEQKLFAGVFNSPSPALAQIAGRIVSSLKICEDIPQFARGLSFEPRIAAGLLFVECCDQTFSVVCDRLKCTVKDLLTRKNWVREFVTELNRSKEEGCSVQELRIAYLLNGIPYGVLSKLPPKLKSVDYSDRLHLRMLWSDMNRPPPGEWFRKALAVAPYGICLFPFGIYCVEVFPRFYSLEKERFVLRGGITGITVFVLVASFILAMWIIDSSNRLLKRNKMRQLGSRVMIRLSILLLIGSLPSIALSYYDVYGLGFIIWISIFLAAIFSSVVISAWNSALLARSNNPFRGVDWFPKGFEDEDSSGAQEPELVDQSERRETGWSPALRLSGEHRRPQRIRSTEQSLSRWVRRGVVHPRPVHTWIGALVSVVWRLTAVAGLLAFGYLIFGVESGRNYKEEIIAGFALIVILGCVQLHFAGRSRCRICSCNLFYSKNCLKNRKAHLVHGVGYVASASLHLLVFGWFRCMYCGTAIRLRPNTRREPDEGGR